MLAYTSVINCTSLTVESSNGETRFILIEPILIADFNGQWESSGIFKLLKDSFYDNSSLAFASLHLQDEYADIPNDESPDYLGRILFDKNNNWIYDGDILSIDQQTIVGEFIKNYNNTELS